jgi:small-conductance mechanosensitive channel
MSSGRSEAVTALRAAIAALVVALASAAPLAASAQEPEPAAEPGRVMFWNREIVVVRAELEGQTPAERAAGIERRLARLSETETGEALRVEHATMGEHTGVMVLADGVLFALVPGDLEEGDTLDAASARAIANLQEALRARAEQRRLPLLLRAIAFSVLATAVLIALSRLLLRGHRRVLAQLDRTRERSGLLGSAAIRPFVVAAQFTVVRGVIWLLQLALLYAWLTFVLRQFPYTSPWGDQLGGFLIALGTKLARGALAALPGLFTVFVIFMLARIVVRVVRALLAQVESRTIEVAWLEPETARATRRIAEIVIWAFALTVAYPYIPGSSSDAFKGVSVFLGLVISLGSAGIANQIMSGFVAIYSRALRPGEYVRVGEIEGVVREVGMLSTKIETRRREEITIPNAVLVSHTTTNFSRLAKGEGAVVDTSVTIGYDAPWRQVHSLLLLAAERTAGVLREPAPFVLQRALSDFYVEYVLRFRIERPEERAQILSALHAQIQDAFNEFGVQILSPHFEGQPAEPAVVPRARWFAAPAARRAGDGGEPRA